MKTNQSAGSDRPRLTEADLENKKRVGQNWMCTCPVCHTHHLSVHIRKGYFKCWYAGCDFHGILEDYRKPKERDGRRTDGYGYSYSYGSGYGYSNGNGNGYGNGRNGRNGRKSQRPGSQQPDGNGYNNGYGYGRNGRNSRNPDRCKQKRPLPPEGEWCSIDFERNDRSNFDRADFDSSDFERADFDRSNFDSSDFDRSADFERSDETDWRPLSAARNPKP